jgi:hypothetical protein
MDFVEDPSQESAADAFKEAPDDSKGSVRWRESFAEQMDSPRMSRLIMWLVIGLALVIVATFIVAA